MDPTLSLHDLRKEPFFTELVQLPFIENIYVFGSCSARPSEVTKRSDVDLLIECPDATPEQWNIVEWVMQNTPCLLTIDVVRMDTLKPGTFREVAMKEKSVLFMRNPMSHFAVLGQTIEKVGEHFTTLKQHARGKMRTEPQLRELLDAFHTTAHHLMRWMRRCAIVEGTRTNGRILTLRYAYQQGWIDDRTAWEQLYVDFECAGNRPALVLCKEIAARMPAHLRLIESAIAQLNLWHEKESARRNTLFSQDPPKQKMVDSEQ